MVIKQDLQMNGDLEGNITADNSGLFTCQEDLYREDLTESPIGI
jgi:hypothetical protein